MKCRHFGVCGGCSFQDVPYDEQVVRKAARVDELVRDRSIDTEVKPVRCFDHWFYRNKMEFTFSSNGTIACGMHVKKKHKQVFDLQECPIFSKDIGAVMEAVRRFCDSRGYKGYNAYTHKGFLRHLLVRESKFGKELMVAIVTTSADVLDKEGFVAALTSLRLAAAVKSLYWVVNDRFGDAVIFENKELLYGDTYITDSLDGMTFRIFVDSFFQTNPVGIAELYRTIRDRAALSGRENVLDLFCGVGSIGLFLAPRSARVWGVEIKEEIVNNAAVNAELNNIKNISFICQDARKFLGERKKDLAGKIDCLVLNPPRCGLSKKIRRRAAELEAPRMFYSSCNPQSLFDDLKELSRDYRIESVEPFDFFPHTPHLECLAHLTIK